MLGFDNPLAFASFIALSATISRVAAFPGPPPSGPFPFSPGFDIQSVAAVAKILPTHSWEYGTAFHALLELYDPDHSVFGSRPFPIPTMLPASSKALEYAKEKIVLGVPPNGLSDGDGAVGDPVSLGIAAMLLGKTDPVYAAAMDAEIHYLMETAPRWSNGAISHRALYSELWADFIFMAPPPMAYYGVAKNNATILKAAVDQCILYNQVMLVQTTNGPATPPNTHPASAAGLWTHIVGPASPDPGLWSSGNAWGAAGCVRVLATLMKAPPTMFNHHSPLNEGWRAGASRSLVGVVKSLLDGAMRAQTDGGLLRNYIDDPTWFGEISGSSMLASVAYRLATLAKKGGPGSQLISHADSVRYIQWAEGIRKVLGTNGHVKPDGTVTPAINPLWWGDRTPFTSGSPEGNNFVVLLYTAWRDCVLAHVQGCSAPR